MSSGITPVGWARWGVVSRMVARLRPTRGPAVLVLSLGRSGSTWVGSTLGQAADALYLHEPLTQSLLAMGGGQTNFEVDRANPPRPYGDWAAFAFAGLPVFPGPAKSPTRIVRYPQQWKLAERGGRRLVIKEVNPFACEWLVGAYRPKVIYLVRHPAAVALSNHKLGFLPGEGIWRRQGEHQGRAHRHALQSLEKYPEHRLVVYEELCLDPIRHFRELFDFAGLTWDASMEALVVANSEGGDESNPWSTARDSREMIRSWAGRLENGALAELEAAYRVFELPWYGAAEDWQ